MFDDGFNVHICCVVLGLQVDKLRLLTFLSLTLLLFNQNPSRTGVGVQVSFDGCTEDV